MKIVMSIMVMLSLSLTVFADEVITGSQAESVFQSRQNLLQQERQTEDQAQLIEVARKMKEKTASALLKATLLFVQKFEKEIVKRDPVIYALPITHDYQVIELSSGESCKFETKNSSDVDVLCISSELVRTYFHVKNDSNEVVILK